MAFDAARGRVVMFGGVSLAGPLVKTWEYDGTTWVLVNTPASPPGRSDHSMVYDSARQRIVLFGGEQETFDLADTWEC